MVKLGQYLGTFCFLSIAKVLCGSGAGLEIAKADTDFFRFEVVKELPETAAAAWFNGQGSELNRPDLPLLPAGQEVIARPARSASNLYVLTQTVDGIAFALWHLAENSAVWQELPLPADLAGVPVAIGSNSAEVYLFGRVEGQDGNDYWVRRFQPVSGWSNPFPSPAIAGNSAMIPVGHSHLVAIGLPGLEDRLMGFHTITARWADFGALPQNGKIQDILALTGDRFVLVAEDTFIVGRAIPHGTEYGGFDHIIVLAFMIGMLWIGVYLARRERGKQDFFRGGRRIPFWASGLSPAFSTRGENQLFSALKYR